MIRKDFYEKLMNEMVHKYFTKKEVEKRIKAIFNVDKVSISWRCYEDEDCNLTDYDAMANLEDVDGKLYVMVDVYYLRCKPKNDLGVQVYVTEIGLDYTDNCEEDYNYLYEEVSKEEMALFGLISHENNKNTIIQDCKRPDGEKPIGYILTYLKDIYNIPKTKGERIANRVITYFNIENKMYHN